MDDKGTVQAISAALIDAVRRSMADSASAMESAKVLRAMQSELADVFSGGFRSKRNTTIDQGNGASSRHFMIELLPKIQSYLENCGDGRGLKVLDVGCGSGSGADLLAGLYPNKMFGTYLNVTALDKIDNFAAYLIATTRYVNFVKGDIFELTDVYDMVIASHVIEHVPDPVGFCHQLQRICSGRVFIATPFDEPIEGRTKAHRNSFAYEFVRSVNPLSWSVEQSVAWGYRRTPRYGMLVMELEGRAETQYAGASSI